MSSIVVNGRELATDEEGYLENLSDWEPDVATAMAEIDDCNLSDNHWEVITHPDQGNWQKAWQRIWQQQIPLRALPKRTGQAGLQVCGSA